MTTKSLFNLKLGIEESTKETAEAEEQAKLEAEALELYKVWGNTAIGWSAESFDEVPDLKKHWLAVATKARELNKEANK